MTVMGLLAEFFIGVAGGIVVGAIIAFTGIWLAEIVSKRNGWN